MPDCPHCNALNPGDAGYCQSCGQPMETAAIPALAAPVTPEPSSTSDRTVILLHLALLLAILLVFSYRGAAGGQHRVVERFGRPAFYTATIVWEWMLLGYVWVGMRRQRLTLAEITGGKWETDRKSTRLNSSHIQKSRMPSSA